MSQLYRFSGVAVQANFPILENCAIKIDFRHTDRGRLFEIMMSGRQAKKSIKENKGKK